MKNLSKLLVIFVFSVIAACGSGKASLYEGHDNHLIFSTVNNEKIDITKYKGKFLIINYWATWCSPCIKELPELVKFNNEYSNKASVIGVNLEPDNSKEVDIFVKRFNVNYPNFVSDIVYKVLGIEVIGYPTTYIFNPKGNLVKTIQGPVTSQTLRQLIN